MGVQKKRRKLKMFHKQLKRENPGLTIPEILHNIEYRRAEMKRIREGRPREVWP